jgi:hypothetical protein
MQTDSLRKFDSLVRLTLCFVIGGIGAMCAFAQAPIPVQLPNGPAKPGFDIKRFSGGAGVFKTFYVEQA